MQPSTVRPSRRNGINRRQALGGMAAIAAVTALRPQRSWGQSPSDELRIASVGVGGMGWADLTSVATAPKVRVVALCDVDDGNLGRAHEQFSSAKTYRDYRRLLDEMNGEIDAVTVSTPDHMHGAVALAAMGLGKHVYVQKPLAQNLAELRRMRDVAAEKRLVTQMGTQIHSHESYRTAAHLLQQGAIGKVREAHLWVGRVWAGPPEGQPQRGDEVPANLDWNLWLGVAPERPYAKGLYHPQEWRGWRDFGTGTLGDMGCHLFDPLFTGLKLKAPIEVISRGPNHGEETYSPDCDFTLTFAGTPHTADRVTFRWTNGSIKPDVAKGQFPPDLKLPGSGSFVVGEKGVMLLPHWSMPTFYRDGQQIDIPVESVGSVDHYHEWAAACRGEGTTSTPFSYACPVTEAVLVGTLAGNFQDQPLEWNSADLSFDVAAANELVQRKYRDGWEIPGLTG
ncbi:MAG: Gfo/Idh/MocA family oxidoreductase [Pirellulales bacterium]